MRAEDVAAVLVGEPWCLTLDHFARLTDAQIYGLYFRPRDKDGRLILGRDGDGRKVIPLPTVEELRIPEECFKATRRSTLSGQEHGIPAGWVRVWWYVARTRQTERGWSDEDLLTMFRAHVAGGI